MGLSLVKLEQGAVPMLSCKEVAERASALIDGELGLFDRLQMRLHLAMCKGCGAFVDQLATTNELARVAVTEDDLPGEEADSRISAILSQLRDGKQSGT
jgi:predicted anti-sigma-YlaC factor YlaD